MTNKLYYGDNLDVLRESIASESVDLIYLAIMAVRLIQLHRVLKPTGSLYLHYNPTASHYLKVMLDAVFGKKRFINEIIWPRANAHNFKTRYWPRQHDVILFYGKENGVTVNPQYEPYGPEQLIRYKRDENGCMYTGQDVTVSLECNFNQCGPSWAQGITFTNRPTGYDDVQICSNRRVEVCHA